MALGAIAAVVRAVGAKRIRPTLEPSGDKEDLRQSASLAVGIAGSVATAALGVLAVLGAIVTYVAANFNGLTLFYGLAALASALMVGAVYLGIRGITEITNKGYEGVWSPWTKHRLFNKQAFASLLGVLVFGGAIVVGFTSPPKPSTASSPAASKQVSRETTETLVLERRLTETDQVLAQILRRMAVAGRR